MLLRFLSTIRIYKTCAHPSYVWMLAQSMFIQNLVKKRISVQNEPSINVNKRKATVLWFKQAQELLHASLCPTSTILRARARNQRKRIEILRSISVSEANVDRNKTICLRSGLPAITPNVCKLITTKGREAKIEKGKRIAQKMCSDQNQWFRQDFCQKSPKSDERQKKKGQEFLTNGKGCAFRGISPESQVSQNTILVRLPLLTSTPESPLGDISTLCGCCIGCWPYFVLLFVDYFLHGFNADSSQNYNTRKVRGKL